MSCEKNYAPLASTFAVLTCCKNRRDDQRGMATGQHLCYISKRCRFCQGFLEELARTDFAKEVRFVCVDPSPSRPPLPAWLKVVPTMIQNNGEEPLIGPTAVNNWLFSRRLLKDSKPVAKSNAFEERTAPIQMPTYSPDIAPRPSPAPRQGGSSGQSSMPPSISSATPAKSNQGPPSQAGSDEGPEAWHTAEMAGGNWSDSYSFVDDGFTSEKGVNRIVRNFELLGGPVASESVMNKGRTGPPQQRSAKEDKLLREFEAFSKSRDMEFAPTKRM
jgi:hypothetical protein